MSDFKRLREEEKAKSEIIDGLLNIMAEASGDKRLSCIPKLKKILFRIQDLTLKDIENKNTAMSDEIISLIENFYNDFNNILRANNMEEL